MTAEQAALASHLLVALVAAAIAGGLSYAIGIDVGRARLAREAFARIAREDAETMRRENERIDRLRAMGLEP